jgi:predicted flap endonuclease-1-like 5' DNA nuclease
MWDAFLRRWLDLLFWWAPRKDGSAPGARRPQAGGAPEPAPRAAQREARAAPSQGAQRPEQPKAAAARGAEAPARQPGPKPAAAQPEKTVAAPVPDDLTEIKGIGPAMQNRLRALGITTFADLAAADPDQLMKQLKGAQPLSLGRVRHWTEAARERART